MQWNPIPGTWDGGEAQKVSVFAPAVQARYVKLIVQTWHSHISMRAGLLVQACHNCKCETGKGGACATCVSPWHRTTANQCATCNPGHILAAGKCEGKILNPPESQRSYSSVHSSCRQGSMLNGANAWCALRSNVGEWLMMDAAKVMTIRGVITRGRVHHRQWVTKFSIQWSTDKSSWQEVPGIWTGNNNQKASVFDSPVQARYIKIIAQAWHRHVSMRAALIVE